MDSSADASTGLYDTYVGAAACLWAWNEDLNDYGGQEYMLRGMRFHQHLMLSGNRCVHHIFQWSSSAREYKHAESLNFHPSQKYGKFMSYKDGGQQQFWETWDHALKWWRKSKIQLMVDSTPDCLRLSVHFCGFLNMISQHQFFS